MAGAPGIPNNFVVQTSNQQVLVSWDLSAGADSYQINRSLDNITFTPLATVSGSPLATSYVDTAVVLGTQYWYQVSALTGVDSSPYTDTASAIPTPTAEMSLQALKLQSRQRADRVNSQFVTDSELRIYINQAMFELYDLLVTLYEDLYVATPIQFTADGNTYLFPLPNGSNTFLNGISLQSFTPKPFYKLLGVDLAIQNVTNGYVTVNKFNFIDRNRYVYPNTSSTIYGVFNMQYRLLGLNQMEFIPTPSGNQSIRVWYIPRLKELLMDTDITDIGISGWLEYVIVRAAKYILDKEESDTTKLDQELLFLKGRIEETASNRDAGMPDTISATRQSGGTGWGDGGGNGGFNGSTGGSLMLPQKLDYEKMLTTWAQQINPVIANLLINGILLKDQSLISGTTVINHKLGRIPQGWFLSAPKGPATVYQAAQQPNPTLTLTVVSDAALTTDVWVY